MNYLLFSYSHSFREHNIHLIITKGDREDQKYDDNYNAQ